MINAEEFVKLMQENTDLSILDIRSDLEFETLALDYPVTHIALDTIKEDIHGYKFKDPTYILCKAGPRAQMLKDYLEDIGEDHFIVIHGGITGCADHGANINTKRQDVTHAQIIEACQLSIQQFMLS